MMTSLQGAANATELAVPGTPAAAAGGGGGGGGTAEVARAAAAGGPVRRLAAAARRLPGRRQLAATAARVTPGQVQQAGPLPLWWCTSPAVCLSQFLCASLARHSFFQCHVEEHRRRNRTSLLTHSHTCPAAERRGGQPATFGILRLAACKRQLNS